MRIILSSFSLSDESVMSQATITLNVTGQTSHKHANHIDNLFHCIWQIEIESSGVIQICFFHNLCS